MEFGALAALIVTAITVIGTQFWSARDKHAAAGRDYVRALENRVNDQAKTIEQQHDTIASQRTEMAQQGAEIVRLTRQVGDLQERLIRILGDGGRSL